MGELKDVLAPRLSATSRGVATDAKVFARNEAWLLLHLLAYEPCTPCGCRWNRPRARASASSGCGSRY